MRCAFSSSSARPQGWHARQACQRVLPVVPSIIQAAKLSRSVRTEHRHQLHSDGASTQHAAPRVAKVSELATAARHPSQGSKPVTPTSPSPLASYEEVAAAGVSAFQRLLYVIMGGALMAMAFSSSAFNAMKESMGGAVAVKTPETERVQQPATATPPHPSAVAPAVSAGAETAAGRASTTTTTTTSTGASTEASTTTLIPKVIPKVDRKVAVKGLTPYDPAAASAFLAGTAVADKAVVPHSLGQLLQIANTCVANGQLFALCILSERACRAQQPDIDQAVSDLAAQGVTVIAVVAGADFAQRAKLAGEYCCWELPALGEALAMQADFGMDVAAASLLPGAFARKDFVPLRLPCFAFGGPHRQADVAWEAHSPVTYVSTADVDTETWALAAAMRVLPLSAPAPIHGVAWLCRQQLHQLSCLKAKLQLPSAGPAAAAHAAVAVLEAEAAAATGSYSASSTSFASSAAAASTEQLPPAYLPASLSHLVPTSVVDFRRRNARATAAGKPLAVIRVSEDAWQKHDASIRAALGAASAGSVWAEPVLLPLSLGDSCGIASPVGSRSLVPTALPALYVGGGGYLAEHWSAEADLLSGQAPAVGPTDMQEAIGLHAMRQRAWLRRREVPGVEVVVTGVASER